MNIRKMRVAMRQQNASASTLEHSSTPQPPNPPTPSRARMRTLLRWSPCPAAATLPRACPRGVAARTGMCASRVRAARQAQPLSSAVELLQHREVVEQLVLHLDELAEALLVRAEPLGQRVHLVRVRVRVRDRVIGL